MISTSFDITMISTKNKKKKQKSYNKDYGSKDKTSRG